MVRRKKKNHLCRHPRNTHKYNEYVFCEGGCSVRDESCISGLHKANTEYIRCTNLNALRIFYAHHRPPCGVTMRTRCLNDDKTRLWMYVGGGWDKIYNLEEKKYVHVLRAYVIASASAAVHYALFANLFFSSRRNTHSALGWIFCHSIIRAYAFGIISLRPPTM